MKTKVRLLILGFVLGASVALPLGINFGREAPLFSNPFVRRDVQRELVERMKSGTRTALEGARERIQDATEPLAPPKH